MFALPNPLTALHSLLNTPAAVGDPDFDPLPAPIFQARDIVVNTETSATLEIFAIVNASPYWGGAEEPHAFVQGYLYVADALGNITWISTYTDYVPLAQIRAAQTWEADAFIDWRSEYNARRKTKTAAKATV